MAQIFVDSLWDAILDSLKVLSILFLAYLLVSFLSHDHSHKFSKWLSKNKKGGVLFASFLGCVPQCGFSSVIADLYADKKVSIGTLVAVFVATSDEAIPILISNTDHIVDLLILIGLKVVLAIIWGYAIDSAMALCSKKNRNSAKAGATVQNEECLNCEFCTDHENHQHEHEHSEHMLMHGCGHIHCEHCEEDCGHSHNSCCADNILLDAIYHTFNILLYIFVATFVINLVVNSVGMEVLANALSTNPYVQIVIAGLVGLIPNCASSVLLVELFVNGLLCFPALLAGLTAGAGVGLVVLWTRNKRNLLQNFGILTMQYLIGVVSGLVLTLVPYFMAL